MQNMAIIVITGVLVVFGVWMIKRRGKVRRQEEQEKRKVWDQDV